MQAEASCQLLFCTNSCTCFPALHLHIVVYLSKHLSLFLRVCISLVKTAASESTVSVKSRPCSALLFVLSIDFIVDMFVWICASSERLVCTTWLLGVFVYKCVWRRVPLPPAALELWIPAIKSRPSLRPAAAQSGFPSAISLWVWYLPFPTLCAYSLAPRREQKKCVLLHITLATVFDLLLKGEGRQLQPDHLAWPSRPWESPRHATFSTTSAHTNTCERLLWHLRHNSSIRQHATTSTAEVGHVTRGGDSTPKFFRF